MSKALIAAALLAAGVVGFVGSTALIADAPGRSQVAPAAASIDVMPMMRDAGRMAEQQFEMI